MKIYWINIFATFPHSKGGVCHFPREVRFTPNPPLLRGEMKSRIPHEFATFHA